MATPKDKLNEILNNLDEFEIIEAIDFIEFLQQKRARELRDVLNNAPEDDEPLTAEELEAIKEAQEDFKSGRTLTFEEVFRQNDE